MWLLGFQQQEQSHLSTSSSNDLISPVPLILSSHLRSIPELSSTLVHYNATRITVPYYLFWLSKYDALLHFSKYPPQLYSRFWFVGVFVSAPRPFIPPNVYLMNANPALRGGEDDHDVTSTGLTIFTGVCPSPRGDGGLHVPHPPTTIYMA